MRPHRNRGLFSNYYLNELLPKEKEFKFSISEIKIIFDKIKEFWDKERFQSINEDQLRKHFLDKVLDCLKWTIDVNPPVPSGEWSKRPDYALFQDENKLKDAQKRKSDEYFKNVICIAEAKRFGRALDKKLKTESDPFEVQNPSLQISRYLWLTGVKWGILTNGKFWRLYERETSKRLDIFYEIDLEDIIESGTPEDLRYFYLLFRKAAFPEFIEKVYKGSINYAEAVGEELKENIYKALKILSEGFLKTPGNNISEDRLKKIHDNSLILLYRLLFILYAEQRGLLPLGNNKFYTDSYSLDAIKKEIATRFDKNEPIAYSTFGYWNKLEELFEIINIGNKELDVPPYNGGLFDSEKHSFLKNYRLGDYYLAMTIDLLSRSKEKAFIDYGSLEIRHLGSIYEGLLEYKLKIALEPLVPIKAKGKEIYISVEEAKKRNIKIKEEDLIQSGEVYLVTDKGERKATGSYYTPEYIVKYIVENTIAPLVEEKKKEISKRVKEFTQRMKKASGNKKKMYRGEIKKVESKIINDILSLKILDPAMGSGHFLVEATDFLARELLKILSGEPLDKIEKGPKVEETSIPYGFKEDEEEEIRWARREVVERCIFGVDLNPMAVELAKVSLWLYTVSKNRPLNFLDHHLRCGNSLIGARVEDLSTLPELKKKKPENEHEQLGLFENIFREKVNLLLKDFSLIERLPSDTVEQIKQKEKFYQEFRERISRFQDVADVWVSGYFGNEVHFGNYQDLQDKLRSTNEEWAKLYQENWFKKAKDIAKDKRFFHWELEFPEIFFEGDRRKKNPGFCAVMGNPPYINAIELNRILSKFEKPFWKTKYVSASGAYDIYILFFEASLQFVASRGLVSLITPNKFLSAPYAIAFRKFIESDHQLVSISDWSKVKVFQGPSVYPVVTILKKLDKALSEYKINTYHADPKGIIKGREIIHSSKCLSKLPDLLWSFLLSENFDLVLKILSKSYYLNKIATIQALSTAAESDEYTKLIKDGYYPNSFKLINTGLIDRYSNSWEFEYLEHKSLQFHKPYLNVDNNVISELRYKIYKKPKIIFAKMALYIEAFLDTKGEFASLNTNGAFDSKYNLEYICSIVNSRIMKFIYTEYFAALRMSGGYFQFQSPQLQVLPIRNISFITPITERAYQLEEVKNYYKEYICSRDADALLGFIESRLLNKYPPNLELVAKHNSNILNKDWQIPATALWEQSDVVHDFLAFLAEKMIEINKEKQEETLSFLEWLESQIRIQQNQNEKQGIESLYGKSRLKNYLGNYQKNEEHLSFDEFWKILEKNKNKIQSNLSSRDFYENIKSEYEKSLTKLLPLKEKLLKTDWLIDQIVYRLYRLTEEEIEIVESQR